MVNESETDVFIMRLLDDANISFTYQGGNNKEIKDALKTASKSNTKNVGFPEFTAKSGDFIIVIEDKAETNKQSLYLDDDSNKLDESVEAKVNFAENGALHYAKHFVKETNFKKIFAFGCSGNEKHHIIKPIFVDETGYVILDEVDNFENFNEKNINRYYHEIVLNETPQEEIELETLIKKSSELHKHLRNYGQLKDTEKPLVVSAILLALNEGLNLDYLTGDDVHTDGKKIYDAMSTNLERNNVGDKKNIIINQFTLIKDRTLLNEKNNKLDKTPLKFFTEYIKNEIFPSITYTKADILGYFYGEFIKYSGEGQKLGIVLTPKHVSELFCDLLDVKPSDKIFDPCCGTGSFLISGMNRMIGQETNEETISKIKANNIHGIEMREDMFTIATTNMILRGDGKSNLKLTNFRDQNPEDLRKESYTVGLMNPPYSQRVDEDTADLSEICFVKHLLDSLADNARCGVIVPLSTMVGKNDYDKGIKKEIYKKHTLEGVITLNPDTFHSVGTMPCIAIFTAHNPHPQNKRCKFINFKDDGYIVSKHVGLVKTERAIERKKHLLECWNDEKDAESKFMVKTKVKPEDEWLHAFYYYNDDVPSENTFKEVMQEYIGFEFQMLIEGRDYLFRD